MPRHEPVRRHAGVRWSSCRHRGACGRSVSRTSPSDTCAEIVDVTGVVPAVNQVELHPRYPQVELRRVHDELGIVTESWSPFGETSGVRRGRCHQARTEVQPHAGSDRACDGMCSSVLCRCRSRRPEDRQRENADVFDFALTEAEMAAITSLGQTRRQTLGRRPRHQRRDVAPTSS